MTDQPVLLAGLLLLAVLVGAAVWFLWRLHAGQAQALRALQALGDQTQSLHSLHASLQDAMTRFRQATLMLAEPGHLHEWVDALQGALQPFDTVQAGLAEHYAVSARLLETTGEILEQAARQRERVEASTHQIAELLDAWTADEMEHRAHAASEIMRHYREAGAQSARMQEGLLELRNNVAGLAAALTSIERIADALDDLAARQRQQTAAHEQAAERLRLLQSDAADQAERMMEWQHDLLSTYRDTGTALTEAFGEALARVPDPRSGSLQTLLLGCIGVLLLVLVLVTWLTSP